MIINPMISGIDSELFLIECKKSTRFNLNKVKELIKNGVNIDQPEPRLKMTAFHFAALNGNLPLVACRPIIVLNNMNRHVKS